LGNIAFPQRLPNTIAVQIEELWRAVLRESGAIFNDYDIRVIATGGVPNIYSEDEGGFPFVTPIFFDSFILEHTATVPPSLTITSEQVSFKPDQPNFVNETAARHVLSRYADWLRTYFENYPHSRVYLAGFMARVSQNNDNLLNTILSEQRAERVKEILVEFGIPETKLIVIGLGENGGSHFRVNEFPNGVFCTITAQQNRKVMLIPDISEDAARILAVKQELDAMRNNL
jgi:hypothetical protein